VAVPIESPEEHDAEYVHEDDVQEDAVIEEDATV
jgi:hypothetical protein